MFCLVKFFQADMVLTACPANLPASRALSDYQRGFLLIYASATLL